MKIIKYLLFIIFFYGNSKSQFPAKLNVNADGTISQCPPTKSGQKYRITVEGTFSFWPEFNDCHGMDAGYVYDVPNEELISFRWPPDTLNVLNQKIPFVTNPHWVGDDKLWQFPPVELGLTPIVGISFRKYKGFRIDDEPLPNTGINLTNHRYQIEKIGTGKPFVFQILDSNYDITNDKIIPRYEDNCGKLSVTIETIEEIDLNICDVKTICNKNHSLVGLKVLASIFQLDSQSSNGKINVLQYLKTHQIGIVDNGQFLCDIDSIVCSSSTSKSLAVGLLIDKSGSMASSISELDNTIRIDALKSSLSKFISNLKNNDSAFVMSFSNSVFLDQDWTNVKSKLNAAVQNIQPTAKTAFYGALLQALDKTSKSSNPLRSLIILSDGCNTYPPDWDPSFLNIVQSKNIPIYIIALGLSQDPCDIDGREKMGLIANASNGKVYDVNHAKQLDSIYSKLNKDLAQDDCCSIYVKLDSCSSGSDRFIRVIYTPQDTVILSKVIKFKCDSCELVLSRVSEENNQNPNNEIKLIPNPLNELANLYYTILNPGLIEIHIVDVLGKILRNFSIYQNESGTFTYPIETEDLKSGIYLLNLTSNGIRLTAKMIIIK